jgi:hypothetical protein
MLERKLALSGALTVAVIAAVLVVLDLRNGSVHRFWSRHSFTSSLLAGLLVLLLTVLIADRVVRMRQLKGQSRAMAAQAAIIVAQAERVAAVIGRGSLSAEDRDEASEELRTYLHMLLISAPVLIDARIPRAFLETAQRVAGQLFRILREAEEERTQRRLEDAVEQLRRAAAPLLALLSREQRAAVS